MPDTSETSATRATRMQHECDTSNTSATRVRHECDTSETRATRVQYECYPKTRVRHECYTNDTSTTRKILQDRHFVVGGPKNFKLLADIYFDSSLQNTVLPSLMLFLCACYQVDLDDIQQYEVVTSTTRNFKNS